MEKTISKLNKHIRYILKGINNYESVQLNISLGNLLDSYSIPDKVKLACLTIDTSMRHLDAIGDNHLSKKAILIGDLLSAHFYTLLAEINDPTYQLSMSKAIVKMNEIKSSLNQSNLSDDEIKDAIVNIEVLFPFITISHFGKSLNKLHLFNELTSTYQNYHPEYLENFSKDKINQFLKEINQSYIKRRGNDNG